MPSWLRGSPTSEIGGGATASEPCHNHFFAISVPRYIIEYVGTIALRYIGSCFVMHMYTVYTQVCTVVEYISYLLYIHTDELRKGESKQRTLLGRYTVLGS